MRALCWNGVNDLRVETVPDPEIVNPHDAILRVRLSTTCGSDLHFIDGYIPTMRAGDVIGHEFMGDGRGGRARGEEGEEGRPRGRAVVHRLRRVLVLPARPLVALRQHPTPSRSCRSRCSGYPTAGIYGYTHAFGGYAGSHAQYIRVPYADNDCFQVPEGVSDEQALFLSDAAPTGYMGADFCDIKPGDTVAVWGCGGVGLMAQKSAFLLGAERVIAIDRFPERLRWPASSAARRRSTTSRKSNVLEALKEMTGGRGPDACIDAVGMEAHGTGSELRLRPGEAGAAPRDRPRPGAARGDHGLPQGRDLSVLGVYGVMDKFPMGVIMNKGLTVRTAQQHGQAYVPRLLEHAAEGRARPVVPGDAPLPARGRAARLRHVQAQEGRLRPRGLRAVPERAPRLLEPMDEPWNGPPRPCGSSATT